MKVCISVFSRWVRVVFHCFGMGHRLRGLRRLHLSCGLRFQGLSGPAPAVYGAWAQLFCLPGKVSRMAMNRIFSGQTDAKATRILDRVSSFSTSMRQDKSKRDCPGGQSPYT